MSLPMPGTTDDAVGEQFAEHLAYVERLQAR